TWVSLKNKTNIHPLYTLKEYLSAAVHDPSINLVVVKNSDVEGDLFGSLEMDKTLVFVLETDKAHGMADQRSFFSKLEALGVDTPVIIKRTYPAAKFNGPLGDLTSVEEPISKLQIYAGTDFGALLTD